MLAVVGFAGCASGGADEASLGFDSHGEAQDGLQNDAARCGETGQLSGAGSIRSGQVVVAVTDGAGQAVFRATYNGPVLLVGEAIHGQPGDWLLAVERSGGFDGDYALALACR